MVPSGREPWTWRRRLGTAGVAVRVISASPDRVLAALTDFDALAVWLPPDRERRE